MFLPESMVNQVMLLLERERERKRERESESYIVTCTYVHITCVHCIIIVSTEWAKWL